MVCRESAVWRPGTAISRTERRQSVPGRHDGYGAEWRKSHLSGRGLGSLPGRAVMAELTGKQGAAALPPGFRLDQQSSPQQVGAPLPQGFTLDAPARASDRAYLQASPQAHAAPPYTGPVLSSDRPWTERLADFAGGVVEDRKSTRLNSSH